MARSSSASLPCWEPKQSAGYANNERESGKVEREREQAEKISFAQPAVVAAMTILGDAHRVGTGCGSSPRAREVQRNQRQFGTLMVLRLARQVSTIIAKIAYPILRILTSDIQIAASGLLCERRNRYQYIGYRNKHAFCLRLRCRR